MSFNIENANRSMSSTLRSFGAEIHSKLSVGELSEVEMLELQHSLGKWSIMVNMQSGIQKTWSEALKSLVQNLR